MPVRRFLALLHPCALMLCGWFVPALAGVQASNAPLPPDPRAGWFAEVKPHTGRPTLFINAEPVTAPIYMPSGIDPDSPREALLRSMAGHGFTLDAFITNCGGDYYKTTRPVWTGPNTWDFSDMDRRGREIIRANPQARILVWIYITAPEWWKDQHPEALQLTETGDTDLGNRLYPQVVPPGLRVESFASPVWREAMAHSLRKVIEHIQQSDWGQKVYGYNLGGYGTFEWYQPGANNDRQGDYSAPMIAAFRTWLHRKYATDAQLRRAWNRSDVTLASVTIPTRAERTESGRTFRDPRRQMNVIDWYQCFSDELVTAIDYFAGVVKQATARTKVVACYYGYLYEFRGSSEFGHTAAMKLLESPNIDILVAPPSYYERQLGGFEGYRRPFYSATLHGKLLEHDNDVSSYLYPKILKALSKRKGLPFADQDFASQLFPTDSAQQSLWHFQRSVGFTLVEGMAHAFCDMHGGYYDHPKLLEGMDQFARAMARSHADPRQSVAQVLVVADEASMAYGAYQHDDPANPYTNRINHGLVAHQEGLIRAGIPFDSIYLPDLPRVDLDRYRCIIFLSTYQVDPTMRRFIDTHVKRDGRTLVWCYAPGLFEGTREGDANMQALTGMRLEAARDETWITPAIDFTAAGRAFLREQHETVTSAPLRMLIKDAAVLKRIGDQPVVAPPNPGRICRLIEAVDPDAEAWGTLPGTAHVSLARKTLPGYTSIYTLLPAWSPELARAVASSAGVHVYATGNDAFYANASYLVLHAATGGEKTIRLPRPATIENALTGARWFSATQEFDLSLMPGETQILRYIPCSLK